VRKPLRSQRAAGYTIVELLVVIAILGAITLVALPNIRGMRENRLMSSNARALASFLKVGRMKAVANNVTHITEIDGALREQCGGVTAATGQHVLLVYRGDIQQVSDCYIGNTNIAIESVADPAETQVRFRANGMAANPNWFTVSTRNGQRCRMVCVNVAGAVHVLEAVTPCAHPYGGGTGQLCPEPPP